MCARILACPLCSQPGFLTLDALRAGLVSVATRPLVCPVCNEVLLGIDKLTIHLFGHTINLSSDAAESSKLGTVDEQLVAVHNAHNVAPQDWNVLIQQLGKAQTVDNGNDRICTELSDSGGSNTGGNISAVDSRSKAQNQNLRGASQSNFVSDYNYDVIKVNILPQSNESHSAILTATNLQQGPLKTNCAMQYFCNDNVKHLNVPQESIQAEKTVLSDLINVTKAAGAIDTNIYQDIEGKCVESNIVANNRGQRITKERLMIDLIEKEHGISSFQSSQNPVPNVCTSESPKERDVEQDLPKAKEMNTGDQHSTSEHRQILPHMQANMGKSFRTVTPKEKTERCNVCGFHFPDANILVLHKQLVHEQDSSNSSEKVLKNYSCHLCSKVFKMRGSLMVHMRVAHVGFNSGN